MADENNPAAPPADAAGSAAKLPETASDNEQADTSMGEAAAEDAKTNGEAEGTTNETSDQAAPAEEEDAEMKDGDDAAASGSGQAAAAAEGTPASSKKAANGSAKKKAAGVPEHKSKKLNKKKSKPQITQLGAQPGEYYLARMKGHPPWPSVICDEEMLPQSLLDTRPVTTKQADGTFKKPEYAEGGKRAYERTFPIMFLHTNEFAWIANTDLTPLDPKTCSNVEAKGKSKQLLAAYATAAENQSLGHYKKVLQDHQEAVQAEVDAQAEREAKKASKGKRKSDAADRLSQDIEDMDIEDEEVAPKPKSKKRKKEASSVDGDEEKPTKTPKTNTKLKLSTPKTPASEPSKKKAAKPKSTGKKAAARATSDDEAVDTPKAEEKPLTAAEMKEKKERTVLYFRHKLQRGFLSRDTTPKEPEMKVLSGFLKDLEGYPDLEGSVIRTTKIHKVLKAMIKLPSIPLDEEFNFKDRSHALLQKWNEILASDPNATGAEKEAETSAKAAMTNGESKDVEKQAEEAEAGEAAAPEEESEEKMEKKIGTTTEGEKEAEKEDDAEATEPEKSDAPAIDTAPAEEYKPPAVETEDEPAA